jgi:hypothetical protein
MNTHPDIAADIPISPAITKPATQLEDCVRQHPGGTILLAAGLGIAAILIARVLTPPPPPRIRALHMLEDIQQQLASLAHDSSHAVSKSVDSLGELHLDRSLGKISRRFKNLFH